MARGRRPRREQPNKAPRFRLNELIRIPNVRLIDADGNMRGIVPTDEACLLAQEAGLDLVEVSPNAEPPVCKILDFGKFQYETQKKEAASKRKVHKVQVKEMRFSLKIGKHDLETKVARVREFLKEGSRVQLTMRFRGARERSHPEVARAVLKQVQEMLEDLAQVDKSPSFEGRTMSMIVMPK